MQVLSSLRSAKQRHPDCKIVKRHGRIFVICKSNPRFKAVQGGKKNANADAHRLISAPIMGLTNSESSQSLATTNG